MLSEGRRSNQFIAGFDYNFGFDFFDNLKEIYNHNAPATSIDSFNIANYKDASPCQGMVRYTSNHDVNSSDGTPQELFGGTRGSMAAFVVVAYMKSVPMIYTGQEVGTPYRLEFPFTAANINWNLNPDLTREYKKIISFRNISDAIRRGKLETFSNDDVCAFTKSYGDETILVISNFRSGSSQFQLPESFEEKEWENVFDNNAGIINGGLVSLQPYQYLVLRKVITAGK
jgi:glycosidase